MQRGYMELGFLVVLLVAFGGGGTPERYVFWCLPIVVLRVVPQIEALIRARRYVAWLYGVIFMVVFQHALMPIEAGGLGGCSIDAYLAGRGTFIGHWTTECATVSSLALLSFYGQVCVVAIAVAYLSSALAHLLARRGASRGDEDRLAQG